jgi:hypothetical protein
MFLFGCVCQAKANVRFVISSNHPLFCYSVLLDKVCLKNVNGRMSYLCNDPV